MHYSAQQIKEILGSETALVAPDATLQKIGFDSRRIHHADITLFFAFQGKSRSGTNYVQDAYRKGIRNFVVPRNFDFSNYPDTNFFEVDHVLESLQLFAAWHRQQFTGLVAGITGSNGKTIVKEWLFHLLRNDFSVTRSPRSYNSGIGVAISLLGMEKGHDVALIEAGISLPGEMQSLQKMVRPGMGIFTHLGSAHDENFRDNLEKAKEKLQLFSECDVLVYPYDVLELRDEVTKLKAKNPLLKTITWGHTEGAGLRITGVRSSDNKTTISFTHRSTGHELSIPFTDKASIENAMTCLCALVALERWDPAHLELFRELQPLENRLVFMEGKNGNYIVNDSYSNDIDSLEVALDFLLRQQPDIPHIVILSDLEQSSADKDNLYFKVAELLKNKRTSRVIGVGPEMSRHASVFQNLDPVFFERTDSLLQSGILERLGQTAVLVKGSRKYRFEQISDKLKKQLHKTFLEIDLNALRNNFNYFQNVVGPDVKIMAMVKAFGYGSGSFEAARTLQFAGADYLAVAYADEGVQLRKSGVQIPVMVMNTGIDDLHALLEYNLEPVIYNQEGLEAFAGQSAEVGIHLEIDTGMHRLGFDPGSVTEALRNIPDHISVESVFSHLAASEAEEHDSFTNRQIQVFNETCEGLERALGYKFLRHIANTAGILRFPESHLNMVRLGIGMYGVHPSAGSSRDLETVISLKTTISQIKKVPAGDSIGYGRRSIESKERLIAVLPIGYADGLWRKLGNTNGYAWIKGKPANYLGNICMDMAMCDVTDIDCEEGDEVEIFGKKLAVELLASKCDTIPYEILTAVSPRVRREYSGEN